MADVGGERDEKLASQISGSVSAGLRNLSTGQDRHRCVQQVARLLPGGAKFTCHSLPLGWRNGRVEVDEGKLKNPTLQFQ